MSFYSIDNDELLRADEQPVSYLYLPWKQLPTDSSALVRGNRSQMARVVNSRKVSK
jgi:hypothetical protein